MKKASFPFSNAYVFSSRKRFFNRMRLVRIHRVQFWVSLISIFAMVLVLYLIAFMVGLALNDLGHHIPSVSTTAVMFNGGISKYIIVNELEEWISSITITAGTVI